MKRPDEQEYWQNGKFNHPWYNDAITMYADHLEKINKELLEACKRFVESSSCQNGCAPDDMSCDTQFAKRAIAKAEGEV